MCHTEDEVIAKQGHLLTENVSIDDDDRWEPVPDDLVQTGHGMLANSERTPGEDQEYWDEANSMRRATTNMGCQYESGQTLGVTYSTMDFPDGQVPPNYNPRRQAITVGLS